MGEVIEELKRDESLDYLKILKALMELPFNVGKNLLVDFLIGDYKNKSITTNRLDELYTFGSLKWDKERLIEKIDELINNGFIESVTSDYNRFIKVLRISIRGQNELARPTLNDKKMKNIVSYLEAKVTDEDRIEFTKLEEYLEGYNEEQKKAIISESNKILCVAGAGTGKTTVLTKRIDHLIKNKKVLPEKILAITFTRKAKQEMEKRLRRYGITNVRVNTFNSFCESILKKHEREIYGRPMRVQSYGDRILAINLALANIGKDMSQAINDYFSSQQRKFKTNSQLSNNFMNDCFGVLEFFKLTGQKEYDFSKDASEENQENAKMIYEINKYLKEHMDLQGLRDYSDQIIDALKFLKEKPHNIPKFEHILVDEYQDVNSMQIELLNLLNAPNLFAVGDPRQSIFGWRGSDIRYIINFEKDHKNAQVIHLTKNYRSSKKIVDFMNKSIKEMNLPYLQHHHEFDGTKIIIKDFDGEHAEREFVIKKILESDIPREEIFVLARTNKQLMELSALMKAANIPHIVKTDEIKNPVEGSIGEVTLATIHAIKGLEARKVFLIGATEQNFPCKASDHPAIEMIRTENYNKNEEEKRLFYVAISRAKERLYITYSSKKPTYFIKEDMIKLAD